MNKNYILMINSFLKSSSNKPQYLSLEKTIKHTYIKKIDKLLSIKIFESMAYHSKGNFFINIEVNDAT